jgi:hypothetical protein
VITSRCASVAKHDQSYAQNVISKMGSRDHLRTVEGVAALFADWVTAAWQMANPRHGSSDADRPSSTHDWTQDQTDQERQIERRHERQGWLLLTDEPHAPSIGPDHR